MEEGDNLEEVIEKKVEEVGKNLKVDNVIEKQPEEEEQKPEEVKKELLNVGHISSLLKCDSSENGETPIETTEINITFKDKEYLLIMQHFKDNIQFKLTEKEAIAWIYYISTMDLKSFLELNRYFKAFEYIKDIYDDLTILVTDKQLSLVEINDKLAKIQLKLLVHKTEETPFIFLEKKNYDKDGIFNELVETVNVIKAKVSKLDEEKKELEIIKNNIKELLQWKSSFEKEKELKVDLKE